jgi:hypothetical protein
MDPIALIVSALAAPEFAALGARLEADEVQAMGQWLADRHVGMKRRTTLSQSALDELGKMVADAELTQLGALPAVPAD